MKTIADKNGTSYQQFKHDKQEAEKVIFCVFLWVAVLITICAYLPSAFAWAYIVATPIIGIRMLLKRTKLPKSSC